jgi:uncharacterized membrane protein (UPF0182 family)
MLPKSKIIFRNKLSVMLHELVPYLVLDGEPYVVVTKKRLFWIQDAYTVSDQYPYSIPSDTAKGQINYIRNSVKIVIDAYNGTVDFYIWDPKDPIVEAYNRVYPGLFKNASQMPADIKEHVRYPKEIFEIQMQIFSEYHMTDPEVFYQREDVWQFPKTFVGQKSTEIRPYYLTLNLIKPSRFDFLLLQPMSPIGRDNLRSLALVGCDPPYYGKIIIYNFPKGELVYGPSQIYALINQDPTISQQFSLWDQAGSRVDRGKIIVLPVGHVILYIQPVYLKSSTALKIPELMRLIVSQGQVVTMQRTLEDAYADLVKKSNPRSSSRANDLLLSLLADSCSFLTAKPPQPASFSAGTVGVLGLQLGGAALCRPVEQIVVILFSVRWSVTRFFAHSLRLPIKPLQRPEAVVK